jgi:hypothetical protein
MRKFVHIPIIIRIERPLWSEILDRPHLADKRLMPMATVDPKPTFGNVRFRVDAGHAALDDS